MTMPAEMEATTTESETTVPSDTTTASTNPETSEAPARVVIEGPRVPYVYEGGNQFGHYEKKPAIRPFGTVPLSDLDPEQRAALAAWEKDPFNTVWTWDVEPGPSNNWAGWGPPPPGYKTRSEIARGTDGSFLGSELPWPLGGQPVNGIQ
jgi:hypothetical protein